MSIKQLILTVAIVSTSTSFAYAGSMNDAKVVLPDSAAKATEDKLNYTSLPEGLVLMTVAGLGLVLALTGSDSATSSAAGS